MYPLSPARSAIMHAGTWRPSFDRRGKPSAVVCCPHCATPTDLGTLTVGRGDAGKPVYLVHRSGVITPIFTCPGMRHGAPCRFADGVRLEQWSADLKDLIA